MKCLVTFVFSYLLGMVAQNSALALACFKVFETLNKGQNCDIQSSKQVNSPCFFIILYSSSIDRGLLSKTWWWACRLGAIHRVHISTSSRDFKAKTARSSLRLHHVFMHSHVYVFVTHKMVCVPVLRRSQASAGSNLTQNVLKRSFTENCRSKENKFTFISSQLSR